MVEGHSDRRQFLTGSALSAAPLGHQHLVASDLEGSAKLFGDLFDKPDRRLIVPKPVRDLDRRDLRVILCANSRGQPWTYNGFSTN